jgi:hypothetical protein
MQVAQRSASVTGIGANYGGYFTCDRWRIYAQDTAGRLTMTQTADGPSGFANCIKLDCTTADASIAAGEILLLKQTFEGQDLQQIKNGTSDAELITVSFYVKANAAFTFGCELDNHDNTRQCTKLFNTTTDWVRHEITFPADVDDGSSPFDDDNAASLALNFWLHAGTTNTSGTLNTASFANTTTANRAAGIDSFFSSTDNNFFITGVQMEIGSQATNFEHRSFGEELLLCSRYFYGHVTGNLQVAYNGGFYGNNSATGHVYFKVPMRAAPTPIKVTGADYFLVYAASDVVYLDGDISANDVSVNGAGHYATTDATKTAGFACRVRSANAAARLGYDAEL